RVVADGVVAGKGAGAGREVVVVGAEDVVVTRRVVTVVGGRVVDVVTGTALAGATARGAKEAGSSADGRGAEDARKAAEVSPAGLVRLRRPPPSVTRHSSATCNGRVSSLVPVSRFPACQPPARVASRGFARERRKP
ncbi:MAG TPA: hypothetical protein VGV86_00775, partial [Acidimicrobiales bacterium]|nr:hypothetical protein [Acidimicrobiales bacterium]